MSKKILKNTNPVVDDSDDDEHEPVEVSSRQSKQAAAEEFQKLQQQLQKQKQQKDKKKSRKHNKLVNLYEEDSTKTTTTEENDEDDDDILDMSVLQSVQEHDENTQKLLSKDGRALTAAGKKRKFSEESMLFKSATREEMNQHKKRRIFSDLNLQVRIVPEKKDDSLDNLLSTTTSIDPLVSQWARKHFILKVHRTTTAKWISEKRDDKTVAPCEVFVSSGARPVHFHL